LRVRTKRLMPRFLQTREVATTKLTFDKQAHLR